MTYIVCTLLFDCRSNVDSFVQSYVKHLHADHRFVYIIFNYLICYYL